jgi:hypothetical protein
LIKNLTLIIAELNSISTLDARTPSYSDNADAAQQNIANMWDVNFWHEFLDEMARDRFNMLSLWSLFLPSLVNVPGVSTRRVK